MNWFLPSLLFVSLSFVSGPMLQAAQPEVGERAPDFALGNLTGKTVRLSGMTAKGPVVLIVLRGYPGYQCPFCNRQVQEMIQKSEAFAPSGAHVLMVYPGPPQDLGMKAKEFMSNKTMPGNFDLLLDPDYKLTKLYGLRWDAPQETAYPSTFVIMPDGVVTFSKIARAHGGRSTPAEILEMLPKPKQPPQSDQ